MWLCKCVYCCTICNPIPPPPLPPCHFVSAPLQDVNCLKFKISFHRTCPHTWWIKNCMWCLCFYPRFSFCQKCWLLLDWFCRYPLMPFWFPYYVKIWHDYLQRSEIWDQVVMCGAKMQRYAAFIRTWRGRRSFRNLIMHVLSVQFEKMKHFQLQRKHTSKWPMLRPIGRFRIQVSVCLEIELLFLKYFCDPSFVLNWSKMLIAEFHFEF